MSPAHVLAQPERMVWCIFPFPFSTPPTEIILKTPPLPLQHRHQNYRFQIPAQIESPLPR